VDRNTQIIRLFQFGWQIYSTLEETLDKLTDQQLSILQKLYAAFHGLSSIGDIINHLQEIRFCKHPDTMQAQANRCKWPDGYISWDVVAVLPGFDKQKYVECAAEALNRWAKVAGIRPEYTPGNPNARIVMDTRAIDGQFGVLAESELPCGNTRQCRQWYDTRDSWAIFDGPRNGNQLDIVRVMCHELGHALGMNHIGAGNLLAPTHSQNIFTPQAGDVAEMQARYGPPAPPSEPNENENYILRFENGKLSVDGYRLTKLVA